ncbi:MAG: DNA-processing protein DprA [Treponema sp.]|jgi:DNA processing protein|nr:DNA-processing protein DprA [Treponema sp.]
MDKRGLLDLIIGRLPGISIPERILLAGHFETEGDLVSLSKRDLECILGRPLQLISGMDAARRAAEEDSRLARLSGIGYISCAGATYPPLLRELPDPPALLFYRGRLPDPELPLAAVVGTRRPSGAAAVQAYDISRELAQGGLPVVSGLALGIDAMAHRGNLEGGASTIAVLGSGLDYIYPAANRMLARRIVETGGVLLSEYPPGTAPRKWHFPARNRIIAGLARGTLIVEAPRNSGALITAQFALDQGRDLWVASAGMVQGEGTKRLASDGAGIISSGKTILKEWGLAVDSPEEPVPFSGAVLASSLARSLHVELKE